MNRDAALCPICGRPAGTHAYSPFCSRRCADVDLQRWFSGAYAIPGAEVDDEAPRPAGRPKDDPL